MPTQHLSDRQKSVLAAALTTLGVVILIGAVGAVFYLLGRFLAVFAHVFLPLAVAGVAALVCKPYFDLLTDRARLSPPFALVVLFLSLLVPLIGFTWVFGGLVVEQITDLVAKTPKSWSVIEERLEAYAPQMVAWWRESAPAQSIRAWIDSHNDTLLGVAQNAGRALWDQIMIAGKGVASLIGVLLAWIVAPIYFAFFLLADPEGPKNWSASTLPFLKAETRKDVAYLVHEFISIIVAFFRGQLIIALIQGVLYALGFSVVGLRYGLILGLMLGFLNIIPYLGSLIGLGIGLPLALLQEGGGLWLVAAVLVVFTIVQMIEGYVLTPRIMGGQTGLHPMVIIVAIFFWGTALPGLLGMILAIPLTAFFVVFWRLLREKYIAEWV
ncbi:MAG: AI-2E family transporter [Acidobacteriota bacterium]